MLSTALFVALLASLVQSATPVPLRTGDVARQLTEQDIAALELVLPLGSTPWLLNGDRAQFGNTQFIQAFLPATVSTPALRRGSVISVQRQNPSDAWVVQRTESYAQVAIAGKHFDQIEGDQDMNRPFRVIGCFDDNELVGLVQSLRSDSSPIERDFSIRTWPILSLTRKTDDSVEVMLRGAVRQGQIVMMRQSEGWIVVVVGVWAA
jgi:hypothetical protein